MFSFLIYILLIPIPNVRAQTLDPGEIVHRGEKHLRGKSTQALFSMVVTRPSFTRTLRLRSWTSGDAKALVEILLPLKEEGIVSLRREMEMWNYLPKTDQVVRVPTSMRLQSWMGSDFTNDDLMKMSRLSSDYRHTFLRKDNVEGESVNVIRCDPKPGFPVVWGKVLYWAGVTDHLPRREEYFDEAGKLVRTLSLSQFKPMDDRVFPTRMSMHHAERGEEHTTIEYERLLFDREIGESIFNREELRSVSQQGKTVTAGWVR